MQPVAKKSTENFFRGKGLEEREREREREREEKINCRITSLSYDKNNNIKQNRRDLKITQTFSSKHLLRNRGLLFLGAVKMQQQIENLDSNTS